jgi:hypothetical protein
MNLLLICALLVPQSNLRNKRWPIETRSYHYTIKSSATKEQVCNFARHMDLVFRTYMALFKPRDPGALTRKTFTVYLFADRREFLQAGSPPGTTAYYSPSQKCLVGYCTKGYMAYMAHEGMHQFVDMTTKRFEAIPMWFHEGMADCIGNHVVRDKRLYMCVADGFLAQGRLWTIRAALKAGKAYSLDELTHLSRSEFMGDAGLCYAQSWSFCHFLMSYPKADEPQKQIPNGKYRKRLAIYYELMQGGLMKHDEAFARAFAGLDLNELEKEWKKYVLETLPLKGPVVKKEGPGEKPPAEDRKQTLRKVFSSMDRDGNGKLTWKEFRQKFPKNVHKKAKKDFHKADKDGSGALSFEEFVKGGKSG